MYCTTNVQIGEERVVFLYYLVYCVDLCVHSNMVNMNKEILHVWIFFTQPYTWKIYLLEFNIKNRLSKYIRRKKARIDSEIVLFYADF